MAQNYINGYFQREPELGITVYRKVDGKIKIVREYDTWAHFILKYGWISSYRSSTAGSVIVMLDGLGNNLDDHYYERNFDYNDYSHRWKGQMVAYWNCDGSVYTVEEITGDVRTHLVDIHKAYHNNPTYYYQPWNSGYKRRAGSCFRHMKTTQERRVNCDIRDHIDELDETGYVPVNNKIKTRGRRRNLPVLWDDYWSPKFKNWKKYRKTQYKSK